VPLHIPPEVVNLKTSYTYVKDVARAIGLAINADKSIQNDVYNLAMEEQMSLRELLENMAQELNVSTIEFNQQGEFNLFPSVTRGVMFIDKIKDKLGFMPTPWKTVLKVIKKFLLN